FAPLSNLPLLGKTVTEYWLEHLATLAVKDVCVLASDRPEQVRELVDGGTRWGLRVEVVPELRELMPTETRARYGVGNGDGWFAGARAGTVLDRLPALPDYPLFNSYADWFAAALAWMPHAASQNHVGLHEVEPGVWTGLRTHIAPDVKLRAPCWIDD